MQKEHEILSNKFPDNTFHILKTNVFALELSKFQSFRYESSQNWDFFFYQARTQFTIWYIRKNRNRIFRIHFMDNGFRSITDLV